MNPTVAPRRATRRSLNLRARCLWHRAFKAIDNYTKQHRGCQGKRPVISDGFEYLTLRMRSGQRSTMLYLNEKRSPIPPCSDPSTVPCRRRAPLRMAGRRTALCHPERSRRIFSRHICAVHCTKPLSSPHPAPLFSLVCAFRQILTAFPLVSFPFVPYNANEIHATECFQ